MRQTIFTLVLIIIITILLAAIVYGSKGNTSRDLVFYYGNTCPHCADVEEWMKKNNIEKKIKIVKKEVYENKVNAMELEKKAKSCGLATDSIGVPFLYTPEGECLLGTPDIVNYLRDTL
ncbi:MAG: hypothetical protein NUV52_03065 [Candidatus Roizmanbacteria bacterium]|nr:hypothetical protein [Candidatus Roizmanbacteria bacterium]